MNVIRQMIRIVVRHEKVHVILEIIKLIIDNIVNVQFDTFTRTLKQSGFKFVFIKFPNQIRIRIWIRVNLVDQVRIRVNLVNLVRIRNRVHQIRVEQINLVPIRNRVDQVDRVRPLNRVNLVDLIRLLNRINLVQVQILVNWIRYLVILVRYLVNLFLIRNPVHVRVNFFQFRFTRVRIIDIYVVLRVKPVRNQISSHIVNSVLLGNLRADFQFDFRDFRLESVICEMRYTIIHFRDILLNAIHNRIICSAVIDILQGFNRFIGIGKKPAFFVYKIIPYVRLKLIYCHPSGGNGKTNVP